MVFVSATRVVSTATAGGRRQLDPAIGRRRPRGRGRATKNQISLLGEIRRREAANEGSVTTLTKMSGT
jgi:hypothetical protein